MAALTGPRSTWTRAISAIVLSLPVGYKAFEGGAACLDTANPGSVYPGASGTSTLIPIGKFLTTFDNSSGSAAVGVQVKLDYERVCRNYDSVTGSGAVTISNQLQEVYIASDHEVTTTVGSNGKAGRVWDANGDGIWVEGPYSGQSAA
jgi:hypothetical protein